MIAVHQSILCMSDDAAFFTLRYGRLGWGSRGQLDGAHSQGSCQGAQSFEIEFDFARRRLRRLIWRPWSCRLIGRSWIRGLTWRLLLLYPQIKKSVRKIITNIWHCRGAQKTSSMCHSAYPTFGNSPTKSLLSY